jgi:hypothetical protein
VVKKAQRESGGNIPYVLNHDTGKKVVILMLRPLYPMCPQYPLGGHKGSGTEKKHSLVSVPTELFWFIMYVYITYEQAVTV